MKEIKKLKIAVFCGKGGIGRTTLSLNLAGYYATQGIKVLLIDRDPQGSASAWTALAGETPFVVSKSRAKGFDVEIYDCPPKLAESELVEADVYVVPTVLDGASHTVYLRTIKMLEKSGIKAPTISVVNKFNPLRSEHRERVKTLDGALIVRDWAVLGSYFGMGQTIFEMRSRGRGGSGAKNDIQAIANRIKGVLT